VRSFQTSRRCSNRETRLSKSEIAGGESQGRSRTISSKPNGGNGQLTRVSEAISLIIH
jgi:hypothetical protein